MTLEGGAPRGVQSGTLRLLVDGTPRDRPSIIAEPATAANVAGVYAALRDDIRNRTSTVAGFADAVSTQRLVENILGAAAVWPPAA